jgi:beta-phosphoglucomutase-like phosphatase (HAD superfamily)
MTYSAVIFDFNGVLLWDNHLQERSWRKFSKEIRGIPLTQEEMLNHVHGRNNHYTIEYLLSRQTTKAEANTLIKIKEKFYRSMCRDRANDFQLSPGAIELLNTLVLKAIPHTIATASGWENLRFFRRYLDLDKWFEPDLLVYDDGTRPGKPAPDIYLQASDNLELHPNNCIVVEDSRSGIEAARRAKIGFIIALGPKHTHDDLARLPGVNQVIENLGQFPLDTLIHPS